MVVRRGAPAAVSGGALPASPGVESLRICAGGAPGTAVARDRAAGAVRPSSSGECIAAADEDKAGPVAARPGRETGATSAAVAADPGIGVRAPAARADPVAVFAGVFTRILSTLAAAGKSSTRA
jgi:hypothetical protein